MHEEKVKLLSGNSYLNIHKNVDSNKFSSFYIHGNSSSSRSFFKQLNSKKNNLASVAVDLLGHGNSFSYSLEELTEDSYTLIDQATSLLEFINTNSSEKINIIGHSFGGHLAIALAGFLQNKVEKLVLINTSPLETIADLEEAFKKDARVQNLFLAHSSEESIKDLKELMSISQFSDFFVEDFIKTAKEFRQNLGLSFTKLVEINEISTLKGLRDTSIHLIFSKNDNVLNREYVLKLHKELKNEEHIQISEIDTNSHYPQYDNSDLVNNILLNLVF